MSTWLPKKRKVVAVAFAGSASAGCVILSVDREGTPEVLSYGYATLPLSGTSATPEAITTILKEVCQKSAGDYARSVHFKSNGAVRMTYGIVHAPWVTSRSARADKVFEHDVVVTDALIGEVAHTALLEAGKGNTLFESCDSG